MDFNKIVARAKNVTLSPKTEWPVIAAEPETVAGLYQNYIVIVAAIAPLAYFIGAVIFGEWTPVFGLVRTGFGHVFLTLIMTYVLTLVMTYVTAMIINALAPSFGAIKNQTQALKAAAYAFTPAWIAGIIKIAPFLGALTMLVMLVAAIYSIYQLNLGLQYTMQAPSTRSAGYTAVVIIVCFVIGFVCFMILGAAIGFSAFGPRTYGAVSVDDSRATAIGAMIAGAQQASNKMEAAKRSNDPNAQAAAATAAVSAMMGGGDQVEALTPDMLKPFVPETLSGLPRTSIETARNAPIGIQVSNAKASYQGPQGGERIDLEITDTGGAKGFLAMAGIAGMESDKQSDSGFEKTYHDGTRLIHEECNKGGGCEYTVVLADRFVVSTKSSGTMDIGALKSAVSSINLSGLEALRTQGVKRG
ncbi:MAG TPA: Yip1 family protein [Rudaea sp.]|nr:Yip1 family protein [Rudaea sp.]